MFLFSFANVSQSYVSFTMSACLSSCLFYFGERILFKLYIFKKHISENEVVAKMGKMKHG